MLRLEVLIESELLPCRMVQQVSLDTTRVQSLFFEQFFVISGADPLRIVELATWICGVGRAGLVHAITFRFAEYRGAGLRGGRDLFFYDVGKS